ncbi:MAG: hypothetical protein KJ706_00245 [Candidatus Omnitrophica bacterium]|nr:hypothetical protein [Candidatus Omnitrophota bacterium]
MKIDRLRDQHIRSFLKLSLSERLAWVFAQNQFIRQFMDPRSRLISKKIRRHGKEYFRG